MTGQKDKKPHGPESGGGGVSYSGEEPGDLDEELPPVIARSNHNRGVRAHETEGAVVGSGAGAGGGGGPEDYDDDPQAGGGRLPTNNPKDGRGGDGPKHNSR